MTNQEKKKYLSRYIDLMKIKEALEYKKDKPYSIKAQVINDMPRSNSEIGDRMAEDVCTMVDSESEYISPIQLEQLKKETLKIIMSLENNLQREVMVHKYINGLRIENICVEMNYSYKYACELHGKALTEIKISSD